MDNIRDLEADNNNNSNTDTNWSGSPIPVPKLPENNTGTVGDDNLGTRNDDDLFGEAGEEEQIIEQELPQPSGERKIDQEETKILPKEDHANELPSTQAPFQNESIRAAGHDSEHNESVSNLPVEGESKVKQEIEETKITNVSVDNKDGTNDGEVNDKYSNDINTETNELDKGGEVVGEDNGIPENGGENEEKPSSSADQEGEGKSPTSAESQGESGQKASTEHKSEPDESRNSRPASFPNTKASKFVTSPSNPVITSASTSIAAATTEDNNLAVPQSHEIIIPSYSRWFNLTKVHPIEKQSLPEFFTNRIPSKTPQVYVKCRNFMVNSYRLNPNEYFSVTTARRNVCGDAAAVFRIHRFLMKWGLINYQVDAQSLPRNIEPPFTGEYSTRHDAPRGLFPFESYKPSVQLPDMAKLKKMMDTDDRNSALHKYLKEEKRNSEPRVTSNPDIKDEDNKESPHGFKNNDNKECIENPHGIKRPKIVQASTDNDGGWNKDSVEKLLKSIQTYGSDWYKIAKSVGSKTPEQCVLKFIQMPIEDRFLHQSGEGGSDLGPLKYAPHLPFSKTENPVLSTLAFLVGLVDPKVIQSMTDRALRKLEPEDADKEEPSSSSSLLSASPPTTKDASHLAISSLAVRSHVFANNEERHMTSIAHQMAQIQLQKVEIKLKLLDRIEKSLELEKKALQRQQEDILIQRISLSKHTKNISQKFKESLSCFDDKEKLTRCISEIESLVSHPPKISIGSAFTDSETGTDPGGSTIGSEESIKPVSVEAPQSYRYWSA